MIKFEVKNLDAIYVVVKRKSGVNYFVGRSSYVTQSIVSKATQFDDKTKADEAAKKWTIQQKSRFKVEPLSKFMVNNFTLSYNRYASAVEEKVSVTSKPMALHQITHMKRDFQLELNNKRKDVIISINTDILKLDEQIAKSDKEVEAMKQRHLKELEDYANETQQKRDTIEKYKTLAQTVEQLDIDSQLEQFKTKTDNTMKTLYGKKVAEDNTQQTFQGHTMILLPLKGL